MPETWSGSRVLVTGGLGFIGSNLVLTLLNRGARVTVVDRLSGEFGGNAENLGSAIHHVELHDVDIRDAAAVAEAIRGQEVIFSLAGQVSHPNSMADPVLDLDLNCRAQLQMLEACRYQNPSVRIVFASTRQIYGRPRQMPVTEQHVRLPVDVNGVSKLATEELLRLYAAVYGLRSVSLRLTNTYGPRMDLQNAGRGFINVCLKRALSGDIVQLFGDGQQLRDFVYVDDVVDAMLHAAMLESDFGEAFNVSCAEAVSLMTFVLTLQQFLDFKYEVVPFPAERKAIDVGDYVGCSQRFHDLTGWRPVVSLSEGLKATVAWHRAKSALQHKRHHDEFNTAVAATHAAQGTHSSAAASDHEAIEMTGDAE